MACVLSVHNAPPVIPTGKTTVLAYSSRNMLERAVSIDYDTYRTATFLVVVCGVGGGPEQSTSGSLF